MAGVLAGLLTIVALAALASSATAAVPKSFFGVMPQGPLDAEDYTQMGDAKVGTLRFELYWAGIDPSSDPGDYDWSSADAVVGNAARNGVSTLPFITSTPPWVMAFDGHDCELGKCPPYPPKGTKALAAWRTFLADAVKRYGPNGEFWSLNPTLPELPIRDWQIWNEQNSPSFYKPKPDVKSYAKLLDAAHKAITGEDPEAKIILGGMFGTPLGGRKPALSAWDFLAKLYRQKGSKRDFEGVAPHPYASKLSKVLAQIDLIRDAMVQAGDADAELWITEIGWASGGPPNPLNRGLAGQADRLEEAFKYFLKKRRTLNIQNLTWYSWRDNSSTDVQLCEWCPKSGLLNENRSAKASFDAFTEFTGGS
ncbi:MAG TPA: hypothetical protein VID76_02470 [Solirubrobacterales bacterium]|jgi:GH35 family endo-1,4-beta-xylanase